MPRVIRDKKTKEYLNCFQTNADDATLYHNAAILGRTDKENLEIIEVTIEEYRKIVDDYFKDHPPEPKPKEKVRCPNCNYEFELSEAIKI